MPSANEEKAIVSSCTDLSVASILADQLNVPFFAELSFAFVAPVRGVTLPFTKKARAPLSSRTSMITVLPVSSVTVSRPPTRFLSFTPVGSVAYKLALVAAGEADMNFSVQPKNEWDVCAGDLLVREAGGHMLNLQGKVRMYNQIDTLIQDGLVAGNSKLTHQMLRLIDEVNP